MHLARKLFGEILPFRIEHRRGHVAVKGGLAHDDEFFEAESVTLHPTDDGRLRARVRYSGEIPQALHSPEDGSAQWFHRDVRLELRVTIPDGFFYRFNVKMLSAPDFFLNDAGRPEPHPPRYQGDTGFFHYLVEITDARWWSSDEHSAGYHWRFSVNDLPELPPLKESSHCLQNTAPGVFPGAYFTCTLGGGSYPPGPVEYWFAYEKESSINRPTTVQHARDTYDRNQYQFSFGRMDKRELNLNEGHRIIDLWEYLLGFCSGTFRTVDIIIGYSDTGGWCYAELPKVFVRQYPCKFSWFPQEWPMDFPDFACQFLTHFQQVYDQKKSDNGVHPSYLDPVFRNRHGFGAAIPILDGYLRAAALELPHDSLNAAFAALEAEVKQDRKLPDRRGIPPAEIAKYLREKGIDPCFISHAFGSYQNTAWGSPQTITGLKEPPEGATSWIEQPVYEPSKSDSHDDLGYGITAIKNWRDKRGSHLDAHAGGGDFYAAQNYANLTLEYLELMLLQRVGYTGIYRSRTGMFDNAVKPVAWGMNTSEQGEASQSMI